MDHLVVQVRDLDAACSKYKSLGFQVQPRGESPAYATANHNIIFRKRYVDLLAVVEPKGSNRWLLNSVNRHQGLGAIALSTKDARSTCRELRGAGVGMSDPVEHERPVRINSKWQAARFCLTRVPDEMSPGCSMFFCEQETPDFIWRPSWQEHPNTAREVTEGTLVVEDVPATVDSYRAILGEPTRFVPNTQVTFNLDGFSLHLFDQSSFSSIAADSLGEQQPTVPAMQHMCVCVADPDRAHTVMEQNGVGSISVGSDRIIVPPGEAEGVILEFVPPDGRSVFSESR